MNATLSVASIPAEQARRRPDRVRGQRVHRHHHRSRGEDPVVGDREVDDIRAHERHPVTRPHTESDQGRGLGPRPMPQLGESDPLCPVDQGAAEAEYMLRDSAARLLLCHPVFAEAGHPAAAAVGLPCRAPDSLVAESIASFVSRLPADPAVVFYTSGTSGRPKGAELSHLNLVMNATVNAFDANDVRADDVALGALPLSHVFSQTVSMNSTWRAGAALVLMPRFEPAEAIRLMVEHGVNTFHGVPTMYVRLISAARERTSLPRLRLCISGGASLPQPVRVSPPSRSSASRTRSSARRSARS